MRPGFLAIAYWAVPPDNRSPAGFVTGASRPETFESAELRSRINCLLPALEDYAADLGVQTLFQAQASPMPINGLLAVVDRGGWSGAIALIAFLTSSTVVSVLPTTKCVERLCGSSYRSSGS